MSSCTSGRAWMDSPCSGSYNGECVGSKLTIDPVAMKVTNC